jgi:hypothetical protein
MSSQAIDAAYARLGTSLETLSKNVDDLNGNATRVQALHESEKRMALVFSSMYVFLLCLVSPTALLVRQSSHRRPNHLHTFKVFVAPQSSRVD